MRRMLLIAAMAWLGLAAGAARAQACAGFADVDAASAFCPAVAWLKNRSVTTGCATGLYCPDQPVTRLAMAAFMSRLGDVVAPKLFDTHASRSGLFDISGDGLVFADVGTGPAVAHTRDAHVTYVCNLLVNGPLEVALDVPVSRNGEPWPGPNGLVANRDTMRAATGAAGYLLVVVQGHRQIQPGTTEAYAVRVRAVAGAGTATFVKCSALGMAVQKPDAPG